jgi:hypothetical protein
MGRRGSGLWAQIDADADRRTGAWWWRRGGSTQQRQREVEAKGARRGESAATL